MFVFVLAGCSGLIDEPPESAMRCFSCSNAVMRAAAFEGERSALKELMQEHLEWIVANDEHFAEVPRERPNVLFVSRTSIVEEDEPYSSLWMAKYTNNPFNAGTIRLNDEWTYSTYDSSILLHELVHFLQFHYKLHHDWCEEKLERHAYRLQSEWHFELAGRYLPPPPIELQFSWETC